MAIVVRRTRIAGIRKRLVPSFRPNKHPVARHPVISARGQCGIAFGDDERFFGEVFRNIRHVGVMIVVAYDVERPRFEQMVERIRLIASSRYGPRRVKTLHHVRQLFREQRIYARFPVFGQKTFRMAEVQNQVRFFQTQRVCIRMAPLFEHLVADAPHKDRRMIAVAQDEIMQIPFVPLVEIAGIIVSRLLLSPHIESLIHHNKAHPVAQVEQFRSGRIVRTADAVAAHLLQNLKLTLDSARIHGGSQASQVVVQAHAVDFCRLSVQDEAFLRVKAERTDSHRCLISVNATAAIHQFSHKSVQVRILYSPKLRSLHRQLLEKRNIRPHTYLAQGIGLDHTVALRIEQRRTESDFHIAVRFIGNGCLHIHHCLRFVRDWGSHVCPPLADMHSARFHEPHVPIDSATGVPARVGLLRVVYTHSQHIFFSPPQMRGKIVAESDVAVRTMSQQRAVEIYIRVHIYAVEHDTEHLVRIRLLRHERLSIPSDSARKRTAARARRIVFAEIALHSPIVRKVEQSPILILEVRRSRFRLVSQMETPAFIKICPLARFAGRSVASRQQHTAYSEHKRY